MTAKENIAKVESKDKQQLSEIEILRKELQALKEQISEQKDEEIFQTDVSSEGSTERKIEQDEYIPVMSLVPHVLNLSTEPNGNGKIKRFESFGQVKRVLYRDLVGIIDSNTKFTEAGYFYILDPDVIRQHGLDDIYANILTKDKMEEILDTDGDNASKLFETANSRQKEIIIELIIGKLLENPDSIDLNVVDRIARISKVSIMDKVESSRLARENREELIEERR
jgi:hypothetical protein